MTRKLNLDVAVTRGSLVEAVHVVHAVVVDSRANVVAEAGQTKLVTWWRSCAKPFQILPFVESGALDSLQWSAECIAIGCGSHGGEPEHVALAAQMLGSVGLGEADLACGPHEPLAARGSRLLRESGEKPTRLHNNCSGKHAAMLARAVTAGWPVQRYHERRHPMQESALQSVAEWCGVAPSHVACAVDGCGVVVFGLPLSAMALSWARLGAAAVGGSEGPFRVLDAMRKHPFLVGGSDRLDTALIEATHGRVIAKVGAEGVYSACVPELGVGLALKVADGALRAQQVALLRLLQCLDALPEELPASLSGFMNASIVNTRGERVGAVLPAAADMRLGSASGVS